MDYASRLAFVVLACYSGREGCDKALFFVTAYVCRSSRRKQWTSSVRELIETAGARLLFLPAYSPDFSPIELAWRKVKAALREVEACTQETLLPAIDSAMQSITMEDARGFYAHCGYGLPVRLDEALQP